MALLAYSLRRAVGALVVLLIVIWLIQFAVWQMAIPPYHPVERGVPFALYFLGPLQARLASEWTTAALEVGIGSAALIGLGAVWRLWRREAT